eukprot:CAMPEP_0170361206 /NCGR_PEP_ID=MMETSP0117_2-20130122/3685_1 /TAXON_ID=400756 /ORGANISM="Durinskia baltica, Strain CSIRO CS-38" /LENGTH=79 /DNA_ID=CAMNT_0010615561 /DNA_START=127 /DNA_END=362 /DNA_ORIENTATION=+
MGCEDRGGSRGICSITPQPPLPEHASIQKYEKCAAVQALLLQRASMRPTRDYFDLKQAGRPSRRAKTGVKAGVLSPETR